MVSNIQITTAIYGPPGMKIFRKSENGPATIAEGSKMLPLIACYLTLLPWIEMGLGLGVCIPVLLQFLRFLHQRMADHNLV